MSQAIKDNTAPNVTIARFKNGARLCHAVSWKKDQLLQFRVRTLILRTSSAPKTLTNLFGEQCAKLYMKQIESSAGGVVVKNGDAQFTIKVGTANFFSAMVEGDLIYTDMGNDDVSIKAMSHTPDTQFFVDTKDAIQAKDNFVDYIYRVKGVAEVFVPEEIVLNANPKPHLKNMAINLIVAVMVSHF